MSKKKKKKQENRKSIKLKINGMVKFSPKIVAAVSADHTNLVFLDGSSVVFK